ncbi:MAG TPA: insulinase family protein [Campylobacterales bacterium]|nr:insulinase family protein [Campylobacterales bacterium]
MSRYLFALILTVTFIYSQATLPTEESLIEGQLPNGFKYTIKPNPKPKNRAELRLLVKAGSLEEDDDQKGIAHFVEHMAFNGSKHFKKNELIQYLESTGVKFGTHLNAMTTYEHTLYKLTIPLKHDYLEKGFLVLEDWAGGLTFDPKEFDKERGVVLEEMRARDNVGLRLYNQSKHLFLGKSKYMERLPIGEKEVIQNISVERAKAFYDDWYRPNLMHLIAVGDFNATYVEQLIHKHFAPLVNKSDRQPASREIADHNATQILSITDQELTRNALNVQYVDRLEETRTKEDMRRGIIEAMMHELFNLKAKEQLLKPDPKATTIHLTSGTINSTKGGYRFVVSYQGEDELPALKELYALLWSFEQYGFAQANLDLIKKKMLADNEKWYKRVDDQESSALASQLYHYALNKSVFVDYDTQYQLKKELIHDIRLDEVNQLFDKVLGFKNRVILFQNTTGNRISETKIFESIEAAKKRTQDMSQEKALPSSLLSHPLKPKTITSERYDEQTGVYEYTLANGIKVAFKPSDFSKNQVRLDAFSYGGRSLYEVNQLDQAQKATGFVTQSGAGAFSPVDLAKILAGKKVSVRTSISKFTDDIYGTANSEDIETLFQLLYLKLTQPRLDKTVEANQKKRLKFQAEQALNSPRIRFQHEFLPFAYKNNPRIFFDTNESIDKLNGETMLRLFKERYADMNNFTFVIVGDVSKEKVEQVISTYLANLPTQKRDEHYIDRDIPYLTGKQSFVRHYNNENIAHIGLTFKSHVPYSLEHKLTLDAMQTVLNIRLRELIREEKSAVYGIRVTADISRFEKNKSNATVSFSCDPQRRQEIIDAVFQEINKMKKEPVTAEELKVYQEKFLVQHETSLRQNSYWVTKIINSYIHNTPLNQLFELPKLVKNVSAKEVQSMTQKIFGNDIMIAELNPKP